MAFSDTLTFESEFSRIGVILHFPIKTITDEIKRISAYRAKFNLNKEEEPTMEFALTVDEDELIVKYLKKWSNKVFDEISSAAINIPDAYLYENTRTATAYTDQETFVSGTLWTRDTVLYRCMMDTIYPPAADIEEWMIIEDGDVKRIYITILLNEFWDVNASTLLESAVFNAMVAAVLKEWYVITNREKEGQQYALEYEQNIKDARSATYMRTQGIMNKSKFF